MQAILKETLACFLPGRAKDLSAHLCFNFIYNIEFNIQHVLQF